ncbi:MAG: hypothetical protein A4E52_02103 [Pelotomaculum sp. PtaB.Bin013]|nr:MAG: hypothetical protein A4E52_02103 [Pelotomaculum sp. PtaB.Bin013]
MKRALLVIDTSKRCKDIQEGLRRMETSPGSRGVAARTFCRKELAWQFHRHGLGILVERKEYRYRGNYRIYDSNVL